MRQEVTEHGNRNTDLMQRQKRETNNETRHASYRRQTKQMRTNRIKQGAECLMF